MSIQSLRRIFTCILWCVVGCSFPLFLMAQQPQLRYIQPDIGAPGMSVYVEFIADVNAIGTFGPDGLYLNGRHTDIRILDQVDILIADTSMMVSGPVSVSWNGRLASTYLYIKPMLRPSPYPTTAAQWAQLSSRTSIALTVNGRTSAPQIFYVVNPLQVGDISTQSQRTVFGQNDTAGRSIGIRSPRGAMLVDALVLRGATYTVSTADPDPTTPGNQGFLPFILMARGSIRGGIGGIGITTIDVSAIGKHGGPGGGGGGGNVYNRRVGIGNTGNESQATDGGNGFTGGGAGSVNRGASLNGSQFLRSAGIGSGSDITTASQPPTFGNTSLNGVSGGRTEAFENGGGGTGHPFGQSGVGAPNRSTGVAGRFGGGSGPQDEHPGGGGGYGTNGNSLNGNDNAGKQHGNRMIVPLAGGSGGASGNPNGSDVTGGFGGGGGGAISISAQSIEQVFIRAIGGTTDYGNDGINSEPRGGGGSGGAVITGTRVRGFQTGSINVDGGNQFPSDTNSRGGVGYIRSDGAQFLSNTQNASVFPGHSMDTTLYVYGDGTDVIKGTGDGGSIDVYDRYDNGTWNVRRVSGAEWQYPVAPFVLSEGRVKYIAVVRPVTGVSASTMASLPSHVLSSVGAGQLFLTPRIERIPEVNVGTVRYASCSNTLGTQIVLATVRNISPHLPLTIRTQRSTGATLGFLLPDTVIVIPLNSTGQLRLRYNTIPPSGRNVIGSDVFQVFHDDMLTQNPMEFTVSARFIRIAANALLSNGTGSGGAIFTVAPDNRTADVNMGSGTVGQTIVQTFDRQLLNLSDSAQRNSVVFVTSATGNASASTSVSTLMPNQFIPMTIRWTIPPTNAPIVYDTIRVVVAIREGDIDCTTTLTINLQAQLSRSSLAVTSTGAQVLQMTRYTERIPVRAEVRNIGASTFTAQLRGVLTYNPSVFYMRNVTNAQTGITVQWRTESLRTGADPLRALIMTVTFANSAPLTQLTDIVTIEGTPLLGTTSGTTFAWITTATAGVQAGIPSGDFTRWLSSTVSTVSNVIVPTLDNVRDGDIVLDVCIEGDQPRLGGIVNTLAARAVPNPASDIVTIMMTTNEPQEYVVEMVTVYGIVVHRAEVRITDTAEHTLMIPVHTLPAGTYIARVRAVRGFAVSSLPITIVR